MWVYPPELRPACLHDLPDLHVIQSPWDRKARLLAYVIQPSTLLYAIRPPQLSPEGHPMRWNR